MSTQPCTDFTREWGHTIGRRIGGIYVWLCNNAKACHMLCRSDVFITHDQHMRTDHSLLPIRAMHKLSSLVRPLQSSHIHVRNQGGALLCLDRHKRIVVEGENGSGPRLRWSPAHQVERRLSLLAPPAPPPPTTTTTPHHHHPAPPLSS